MRSSSGSSRFARELQELIDAADSEFDDVQGEERSGTSASDVYDVTLVPSGFRRCSLFIPHRTSRGPRVHCWAKEGLSYREALDQVIDVLGPSDEQDGEEQRPEQRLGFADELADANQRQLRQRVIVPGARGRMSGRRVLEGRGHQG